MTRMLTIISGAGIMVLVILPVLEFNRLWEGWATADYTTNTNIAAKSLLFALLTLGITITGPLALIMIRLFERRFRG